MPANLLRHIFADTVADVDGVLVRTHLCAPPGTYGGGSSGGGGGESDGPSPRISMSKASFPPTVDRNIAGGRSNGCRPPGTAASSVPETVDVTTIGASRVTFRDRTSSEPLCVLSCCCGGRLLILLMVSHTT